MSVVTVGIAKAQTDTLNNEKATTGELRHELGIVGGGGMSVINYSLNMSGIKTDGTGGISGFVGISYTWNVNRNIGILTGLDLISYGAKTTYETIENNVLYQDAHIDNFYYRMDNYIEEQSVACLSIPMMLQYSVPLSGNKKFYMSGGFKLSFPINAKATIFPGIVTTRGYINFDGQTYYSDGDSDVERYGFVTNKQLASSTNDIDVNVFLSVSLETGARFYLTDKILLYTGVYLDYGLNNIRSTKHKELLYYEERTPPLYPVLKHASVLNTSHVNDVKTLGVGLKVKVSFGW
jgi:hypothetical protein